jgi:hypothetical protein
MPPASDEISRMKRLLFPLLLLAMVTAVSGQERFSERLTVEQRKAAGLDQLTAEQLAALDSLVKADQQQGVAKVQEKARAELREEVKAEVRKETKEQVRVEVRKEEQQQRDAESRILSRIAGKFSGWDGATQFKLENGQVWRQTEPGVYYVKPVDSPAVLIEKVFGSWRLYDQNGGWVRVVRIK